ncbi:ATP-binding domain-containing protein [Aerophototrophica crusticola]|uniref:ATP-binding domain-containing protein n=1 Tax=Aerophototrophica crusticola TaxID=1709002 RepID=A0A858RA21_9PROT|nr:ATP-binding domain-containing protein [Rhodospirillaceae bacterium B3]
MFDIANTIAYKGLMVYGTMGKDTKPWLGASCWIDVVGASNDGHWLPDEGARALELLRAIAKQEGGLIRDDGKANVYVISPFRRVADEMRKLIAGAFNWQVARQICGTVHTFQGKEADAVVLLLGGNPSRPGAITTYAGRRPNILNVAVTRAKQRLYVIGNHGHWARHQFYSELAAQVPRLTWDVFKKQTAKP